MHCIKTKTIMDIITTKKKITLSTVKAFAKRNADKLFIKEDSSFSGMSDMVEFNNQATFRKTTFDPSKDGYYKTGIDGFYTVGRSNDIFELYETETHVGIHVYNSCGSATLVIEKEVEEKNPIVNFTQVPRTRNTINIMEKRLKTKETILLQVDRSNFKTESDFKNAASFIASSLNRNI